MLFNGSPYMLNSLFYKNNQKIIPIITGPTASGKSDFAIKLALKYGFEIISADSMQIYKGLDIGTAKVSISEQKLVPHHLIDIRFPSESYSVVNFQHDSLEILSSKGNYLVCGGSSQYICSLLDREIYSDDQNSDLRNKLETTYSCYSNFELWQELNKIDNIRASQLNPNDRRRVLRAIEKYKISGILPSKLNPKSNISEEFSSFLFLPIYIDNDRDLLYQKINKRVDQMMKLGLLEEAEYCYKLDKNSELSSTCKQAIAYKEFFPYFKHELSLNECIDRLKINSRHYAKRQITWWKRRSDVIRLHSNDIDEFLLSNRLFDILTLY